MAKSNTITEHSIVPVVIHLASIFNKPIFNTSCRAKRMHSYYIIIVHDVYLYGTGNLICRTLHTNE